ncbi:hypothetical protein NQ038_03890 [Brevibacterium sp. 50QC2O2]|uniref:hypothetical protein n=1 Tax=Brevibacterium TaxID=1696 RepID=UPI00211BF533|nr:MULTISPECIES: hypothetical protein [unclassified Brevibacterium]MCQ9369558.1 hypothetical protein [Brevibacterium sp. 91QC2O2]MCQ9385160.1 hypothetical protein [Brevibacterium sp. 68QC2CO]MCQ9387783.1 hypothetical protein [Brevibacterium sp. 50QC2O2]
MTGPEHSGESPESEEEAVRRAAALQAAKEAYRRTLRNEAPGEHDSAGAEASDWQRKAAWLRAQRPPHWG